MVRQDFNVYNQSTYWIIVPLSRTLLDQFTIIFFDDLRAGAYLSQRIAVTV